MANFWDDAIPVSPLDVALYLEGVTGPQADLARSIYQQESGSGRNATTSNAGAVGGMQIIPSTFASVADKGWNIDDPVENARAGVRYLGQMLKDAGGDPRLAAIGYYGGPGAIAKARNGKAVSDPRNPNAPDTFGYADSVMSRIGNGVLDTLIPKAEAGELPPWMQGAQPVAGGLPDWMKDAQPVSQPQKKASAPSLLDKAENMGEGIWMGVRDPIDAGAQMLRRAVPDSVGNAVDEFGNYLHGLGLPVASSTGVQGIDRIVNQANKAYETDRAQAGRSGFDVPRLLGNMAGAAPLLAAAPEAAPSLLGKIGGGLLEGGLLGAFQPVVGEHNQQNFWSEKARQAALGSALGGATTPLTAGLGRMISPIASRGGSQASLLAREGIDLTPGQIAGGALMNAEDKLMSVPILGDAIRGARTRGIGQFNRAVYNRVLAPIGETTQKVGRDAVDDASNKISAAYDKVLSGVQFAPDGQLAQDIANLRSIATGLPAREAEQFDKILEREVVGPLTKGQSVDGRAFKDIESQLGNKAMKLRNATDAYQNDLGDAVAELQNALRQALVRQNPQAAVSLRSANQAFAMLTRLQEAAAKTGAENGVFSPTQFSQAVRSGDKTVRKNAFARGNALMQDLGDAGKSVMSSRIPNSGTTDRLLLNAGALGSAAVNPAIPLSLAAASLPYLPLANRFVPFLMTARPAGAQRIAGLLGRTPVGLLGALAGQL